MDAVLEIKDLHVNIEGKEILKGVDLAISKGKIHALMGPNGSGKSTLAYAIMGHPRYQIIRGTVSLFGQDIMELTTDERARRGLFLGFQYPSEISGLSVSNFLRTARNFTSGKKMGVFDLHHLLQEKMKVLDIDEAMAGRYLNEGFSGGEKKRNEILQMLVLEPRVSIMDEIDSGLDVDALRIVARGVNELRGSDNSLLLITHYQRILQHIQPDLVHVMMEGRVVMSGEKELAQQIEAQGYDWIKRDFAKV